MPHSDRGDDSPSSSSQSQHGDKDTRRRKVRKGTHSCWECRKRKVRCQYASPDDRECIGCQARGSACRSQEFADEVLASSGSPPERKVTQRLGRLEEMMESLVGRIMPETTRRPSPSATATDSPSSPPVCPSVAVAAGGNHRSVDVFETSTAGDTPVAALLGIRDALAGSSPPSPGQPNNSGGGVAALSKYLHISKALHALFPSQRDMEAIVRASAGPHFVVSLFHSARAFAEGRTEPPSSVAVVPPVTSHPAILARRLLQLALCMQQISPSFLHLHALELREPLVDVTNRISAVVSHAVTSNDELVSSVEGLECLVLLGFQQASAGNLRKAWLSFRRALSLGQLVGIDQAGGPNHHHRALLRSCDPSSDSPRPSAEALWHRINCSDRYLSMLLGRPVGSPDDRFTADAFADADTPMEKMEKKHAAISGRVVARNLGGANQTSYALTQAIDCDLEAAAKAMGPQWWEEPALDALAPTEVAYERLGRVIMQIHHFTLLILLHLPYMLRDPAEQRYDYSKATCLRSSRRLLARFVALRSVVNSAYSCRHVDYAALMAAMTLLLAYLGPRPSDEPQRLADRALAVLVRERMRNVAVLNEDRLSQESADIIGQLLPIIDLAVRDAAPARDDRVHLTIPYVGTFNIPRGAPPPSPFFSGGSSGGSPAVPADASQLGASQLGTSQLGAHGAEQAAAWGASDHVGLAAADDLGNMFMDWDVNDAGLSSVAVPDLMAESDDWVLQGVDTTYWSLLKEGVLPGTNG